MATKAELTEALELMLKEFGPGSLNPDKGRALRKARVALGKAFPWELRREQRHGPLQPQSEKGNDRE
jgi:hypothetical protein